MKTPQWSRKIKNGGAGMAPELQMEIFSRKFIITYEGINRKRLQLPVPPSIIERTWEYGTSETIFIFRRSGGTVRSFYFLISKCS